MKIGNIETKNNFFLAPMAGITTSAFRKICLDHNAGAVYAEMISDKGIYYQNEKTLKMVSFDPSEHPLALQLFGNDSSSITFAAKKILELCTPDMLDVNMGCPVQKVVKNGSGSALMKTPEKIYEIVSDLKENVNIPITIKIRAGWDHSSINCDEVAKLACRAGVDAIAIHGRTRSQMYNGTCNLDYIKMVKEVSTVPVIGSGDVKDIKSAEKMFNETGVDAIMIGRGSLGNPWIFDQLNAYFNKGEIINPPSVKEIIDTLLLHAKLLTIQKGEHIAMIEMRSHAAWYLKLIPQTKTYRTAIVAVKTYEELEKICEAVLKKWSF